MKESIAKWSSDVLAVVARSAVRPASIFWAHAPKVPQELLKKK